MAFACGVRCCEMNRRWTTGPPASLVLFLFLVCSQTEEQSRRRTKRREAAASIAIFISNHWTRTYDIVSFCPLHSKVNYHGNLLDYNTYVVTSRMLCTWYEYSYLSVHIGYRFYIIFARRHSSAPVFRPCPSTTDSIYGDENSNNVSTLSCVDRRKIHTPMEY